MHSRSRTIGFGVILVLGLLPQRSQADVYEFLNGGEVRSEAKPGDGIIRFEVNNRTYRFLESAFKTVTPEPAFAEVWRGRISTLEANHDLEAWLQCAHWALERGRVGETLDLIQKMAAAFPKERRPAQLLDLIQGLERPKSDPDRRSIVAAVSGMFQEERSANVLVLHQGDPDRAQERLRFLEEIILAFYLDFALRGVDLDRPESRSVVVEWSNREAYLAFLNRQNAGAFRGTTGFYHPTLRIIASFQVAPRPKKRAELAIDRDLLGDPAFQDQERRGLLKASKLLAEETSTAAHEMVHHLTVTSGLMSSQEPFPIWLQEGLAMQFEWIEGTRWGGISRVHPIRLGDFSETSSRASSRLMDILEDKGFGSGYRKESYASAWALVYYLQTENPLAFQNYLDRLRLPAGSEENESAKSSASIDAFRDSFGKDFRLIEQNWREFMSKVKG